jgi:hypothetical protein
MEISLIHKTSTVTLCVLLFIAMLIVFPLAG